MPVDQSGENILFILDGTNVEAHIQIQYTGDPARFAWLIPVQKIPEVEVGSQLFFSSLLAGSVPTFVTSTVLDSCPGNSQSSSSSSSMGCGSTAETDSAGDFGPGNYAGSAGSAGSGGTGGTDPNVVKKVVGAFDVSILEQTSPIDVVNWLTDNNFQVTDTTAPLIAGYVDQGYVFVAVRLTPGSGTSEIHPLVIRYPGDEPCVPLKLTAVAATENMGVRAFFLGKERVLPVNYKHVVPSEAHFDWINLGSNYNDVISAAVDSPVANGRAFVTEYAGDSSVIQNRGYYDPNWNGEAFRTIAPEDVVSQLFAQGLIDCTSSSTCTSPHPLVFPLLEEYLPRPSDLTADEWYSCLSCHKSRIDLTKWDANKFADDFNARIQNPAKHASDLVQRWPYLTRLFTTISPAEMTEDPIFAAHKGWPTVSANHVAQYRITCTRATGYETSDGQTIAGSTSSWPTLENVPYATTIDDVSAEGRATQLVDNTAKITTGVQEYNKAYAWPPEAQFYIRPDSSCGCEIPTRRRSTPLIVLGLAACAWVGRRLSRSQRARSERA